MTNLSSSDNLLKIKEIMKTNLKKASIEEMQKEIDSRTPYIFSTDTEEVTPDNIEQWFVKEWKASDEDINMYFWVWKKNGGQFMFGFGAEHEHMFFSRNSLKEDGADVKEFNYSKDDGLGYKTTHITEDQMKKLWHFGRKYSTWKEARKRLNPKRNTKCQIT